MQSVAHWVMSRDGMVFMVPSVDAEGIIHRGNIRLSDYAQHLDGLVLQGGADTDHANKDTYDSHTPTITLGPDSALAQLYPGQTQVRVNSIHHQVIRTLGRDLVVEAWSAPDRVIEVIRKPGRNYVFGVQWHPEFIRPGDADLLDPTPILDDFLNAVRKRS
jgi:gamma-glutamyl-gamma-aminobutyrate hydrolase PuuD